jgi:hypothetical protein
MILVEESTKQEAASNGHSPLFRHSEGPAELLGFFIKILSMSGRDGLPKALVLTSTQEPVFKTAPQELLKMVSVVSRGHILPRGRN